MPSQLNGKRTPVARGLPVKPRCPRNGTADDEDHASGFVSLGKQVTAGESPREGRRGRSVSPDTGQQASRTFGSCSCRACPRGSGRASLAGTTSMFSSLTAARSPRVWSGRLASAFFIAALQLARPRSWRPPTGRSHRRRHGNARARGTVSSTSDIVVIDAETIRNTSADSLEDLIRRSTGMQLARNGGPGQSTGFFIRGASTNSTVVLVDGVRVGSATLGQAEFEALSLAQIEHIEVLRGPASSLYGADAVGGVVQIFTRRGDGPTRFSAAAEVGGYGSRHGDIGASGSAAGFDYAASLGRDSSHGVSAIAPGSAISIPTATASRATPAPCASAIRPRRDTASASRSSRPISTRSTTALISHRRISRPIRRPISATASRRALRASITAARSQQRGRRRCKRRTRSTT